MNTLSPLDADEHAATGLLATLSADEALARKFLSRAPALAVDHPAADSNAPAQALARTTPLALAGEEGALGAWEIDYAPMRALLDGGLADV